MAILFNSRVRKILSIKSPVRLLLIIIIAVCVVEFLLMLIMSRFTLKLWEAALIDSLVVFIVMFTLLFKFMILPLISQIDERKKALKSLKISEDRYRNIFKSIQDVYFEITMGGVFTEVSPSVKVLTSNQYHRKDLIGQSIEVICTDHQEHQKFKEELMKAGYLTDYEFIFRNADGNEIPCSVTARLFCNESREPLKITGSLHNISRRKEIEAKLLKNNEQLKIINSEKDKLFSIIAHDLKTPFSAFLGLTSLMADKGSQYTSQDLRRLACMVNASANNLHQLLENLLQWSQMKRNTIKIKKDRLPLFPLVNNCIESLYTMADSKEITLENNIAPHIRVYADELMIKSVLRNLITNALKFTNRGGKVTLNAILLDDTIVQISVADTGIGISPELSENLFRIDVKTSRPGTEGEPSTGLGLILCKELIEKNKGKIWVESQPGSGSTFYFTLETA